MYGDALMTDNATIGDLVTLYAMVSRMRVMSSPEVVQAADAVVVLILDTYFKPKRTMRELSEVMKGDHLDPLRTFSEACREDLKWLRSV